MTEKKTGTVLVIGAGVGGIRAAFDLAESGLKVYLVDRAPGIGGTIAQLTKWFPDNQCEMCKLIPVFSRDNCSQFCLRRDIAHPNIELITGSRVEKLEGETGNFTISLVTESYRVKKDRCIACGKCVNVCPVEVPDEFESGLKNRKAVYVRNPQAVPNIYAVDPDACTKCGECVKVCPTDAIDLVMPEEKRKLDVGAVIVSSGFDEFDASQMGQYGFERYPNVLTNLQLERELASAGATGGKLKRSSDGAEPKKVAILQCVGSRDMKRNYCSAACCMYALKESILIKEYNPDIDVTIYYMDMRAFGKDYYRSYLEAKALGVHFVRCRVSTFREDPKTKNLLLVARAENGELISSEFGLVVISVAQCPSSGTAELSKTLGVKLNKWGFIDHDGYNTVKTSRDGIYLCGSASAPSDIAESVLTASAAAGEVMTRLSSKRVSVSKNHTRKQVPGNKETKIAVYLCKCGDIIPAVVDINKVAEYTRNLHGVVNVEEIDYLCMSESLDKLKESVKKSGANRVIIAACAPYRYYRMFNEVMTEAGIDASLWQLVNFREQIAWVNGENPALATEKACSLLAVAASKLDSQEKLLVPSAAINNSGLVIGGGISGLVAALSLAEKGFMVHLVEKTGELGGHVRDMYFSLGNSDPQAYLKNIINKVKSNALIHLYLDSKVADITGNVGSFKSTIKTGDNNISFEHGAVIIATGAQDYKPSEYQYGQKEKIITQKSLQKKLSQGKLEGVSSVVMIQCVGSRDDTHPYCNRTCCSEAIANALKIKELSPETEVYILNRDIMTYGFREEYYTKARESGVIFLRYEQGNEPQIKAENKIAVTFTDPGLPGKVEIEADLLVLSTGIVAGDNSKLASMLALDLTEEGFFREVDIKFRPVDAVVDGVYITGLACSPRNLDEEITQAKAAAQRAANVLFRKQIESGRIISEVNSRKCSFCGLCVEACPFNARWLDKDNMTAVVKEILCQGCGTCVAVCPNSAAKLRGMKDKQVFSMIDAAL